MGALYFGEFNNFTTINFITFFIGVFLDIVGGVMLQARDIDDKSNDDDHGPTRNNINDEEVKKSFSTGKGSDRSTGVEMTNITNEFSNKLEELEVVADDGLRGAETVGSKDGSSKEETVWHTHPKVERNIKSSGR